MPYLLLLILMVAVCPAEARTIRMTIGANAYLFDYNYAGRTIDVYLNQKDDDGGVVEGLAHAYFIIDDMFGANPSCTPQGAPEKLFNGTIAFADYIDNALAIIYKGKRYLVLDPKHDNVGGDVLLLGHEIGHHLCGHTDALINVNRMQRELEADRVAGALVKRSTNYAQMTREHLLEAAGKAFKRFGDTHPPIESRLAAIEEGYQSGTSPCFDRIVPSVTMRPPMAATAGPSLWEHNGSTMLLQVDGSSRKFLYEKPRAGMLEVGVKPGTVLFEGLRDAVSYRGTAYIFTKNCGSFPYLVTGSVSSNQLEVQMTGQAPRISAQCQIVDSKPDLLRFTYRRK